MGAIELKPCPFCGGKPFFDIVYFSNGVLEHCIACTDCDGVFIVAYKDTDENDLAEAWNRRADEDTVCGAWQSCWNDLKGRRDGE